MDNPLKTKTITLSCGKLTTGVTVKPWTGIFMLRNSSSALKHTFKQHLECSHLGQSKIQMENHQTKPKSSRRNATFLTLPQISALSTSRGLCVSFECKRVKPREKRMQSSFTSSQYLAYDGSSMKQVDAAGVLGPSNERYNGNLYSLRRWESASASKRGQWNTRTDQEQS